MKKAIIALTILFTNSALASERLGEWIVQNFQYQGKSGQQKVKVHAFDAENSTYTIRTISEVDGQQSSQDEVHHADDMWTHQSAETALIFCPTFNGEFENMVFKGKTYKTCKLPLDNKAAKELLKQLKLSLPADSAGHAWIGNFPVNGMFKVRSPSINMDLVDFHWNN